MCQEAYIAHSCGCRGIRVRDSKCEFRRIVDNQLAAGILRNDSLIVTNNNLCVQFGSEGFLTLRDDTKCPACISAAAQRRRREEAVREEAARRVENAEREEYLQRTR
jgi:hypothetical protein